MKKSRNGNRTEGREGRVFLFLLKCLEPMSSGKQEHEANFISLQVGYSANESDLDWAGLVVSMDSTQP